MTGSGSMRTPPDFFHAMLDLFFERENVGGCGAAAIDDRERVPSGNANAGQSRVASGFGTKTSFFWKGSIRRKPGIASDLPSPGKFQATSSAAGRRYDGASSIH
jgi:hypothetical protein